MASSDAAPRVGFSLSRAPARRVERGGGGEPAPAAPDLVTSLERGRLTSAAARPGGAVARVIAPLADTFQTGVGKRPRGAPSFLPDRSDAAAAAAGADRFEKAVENETAQAGGVHFGLNERARPDRPDAPAAAPDGGARPAERSFVERALAERAAAAGGGGAAREAAEAAAFRDDLSRLPDAADAEAYESMPVEAFGEAMLRGMGWREGGPVGRNQSRAPVKPIEYVPRPQLLGLGAQPAAPPPPAAAGAAGAGGEGGGGRARPLRPGESRAPEVPKALPVGPDGRVRNIREVGEALVARPVAGCVPGKRMVLVGGGPHAGLSGTVLAVERRDGRSDRATLRLGAEGGDGAVVAVRCRECAEPGSREAGAAEAARAGAAQAEPAAAQRRHQQPQEEGTRAQRERQQRPSEPAGGGAAPWLAPHIRVRVVSSRLAGGSLYLRKAVVVDVTAPGVATLAPDGGGPLLDSVPQSALETLPPRGGAGRCAVVGGRWRGARAQMLGRDAAAGTAHVRLNATLQMATLALDDVAEYVGPHDEHD